MKGRKEQRSAYENSDYNIEILSSTSELQCTKHPPSPTDGICAHCLRDKLLALLCPRCEELLCSCSVISSVPNPTRAEAGNFGRISFQIENEKAESLQPVSKTKQQKKATCNENTENHLRRSNSSNSTNVNRIRKRSFWEIVKVLGRRKSEKGDVKSQISVPDFIGVPRSRSFSSFRGGSCNDRFFHDPYQGSGRFAASSVARVTSFGAGFVLEPARRSCFSEYEARISNFDCERESAAGAFSCKFTCEDPRFIDLKLELSSKAKPEISTLKRCGSSGGTRGLELWGSELRGSFGMMMSGSASRRDSFSIDVKKCRKKHMIWRWLFKR